MLACSEDVLPLDGTLNQSEEQCIAALRTQQNSFEPQLVIDPPAAAAIDGEFAVVLESLDVVRFSSDARDPGRLADHD